MSTRRDNPVRFTTGVPVVSDFASAQGSPIAIDLSTANGYALINGIVTQLWSVGAGGSLTIEEVDGVPSVAATKLVMPNGTLTVVGTVVTYTPTGGAGTVTHSLGPLTQYAVVIGNGADDITVLSSLGNSGDILTSAGAGAPPSFQSPAQLSLSTIGMMISLPSVAVTL